MAKPMNFFSRLGAPIVRLLGSSTRVVLRTFSLKPSDEPPVTEEEIKVMMEQGAEAGVFQEAEHDIVKSIFKLGDRAVSALMKPRREVVWLDLDDPFEAADHRFEVVDMDGRRVDKVLVSRLPEQEPAATT